MSEGKVESQDIIYSIKIDESQGEQSVKRFTTSIGALTEANKRLRAERRELDLTTEHGTKRVVEINAQIDRNTKIIKENSSVIEQQRMNVGNYTGALDKLIPGLGATANGLMSMVNPTTALVAGMGALIGLYAKSTAGARDLAFATDQLSSSFTIVANGFGDLISGAEAGEGAISKLVDTSMRFVGNQTLFGNALKLVGLDLNELANKSKEAATALFNLRQLELDETDAKAVAKVALQTAEQNRRIRDDENKGFAERMAAAKQVEGYITVREQVLVQVQQDRIKALQAILETDKNNLEVQKQIKVAQFEIRDIQEDSEGKRTEALNGINALLREQVDLDEKVKADVLKFLETLPSAQAAANEEARRIRDERLKIVREGVEAEVNLKTSAEQSMANTSKAIGDRVVKTEEQQATDRQTAQRNMYSAIGSLSRQFAGESKKIARSMAFVNMFAGVAQILATKAVPFIEPFASITRGVQIAGTLITGYNAVRQINSAPGFAWGGLTGQRIDSGDGAPISRSNGDNLLATVRTGEVILNERQQRLLGGANTFRQIGVPGFASGGITTPSAVLETLQISNDIDAERRAVRLVEALGRSMPRQVAIVEDITKLQEQKVEIQSQATI